MTSFSTPNNFAVGDRPYSVDVADFNGDGKLDVVVANAGAKTVSVLLGDGAGGFTTTGLGLGSTLNPISVFVGDFDADGKQDIATANIDLAALATIPPNPNPNSNISIRLGNGDGTFAAPTIHTIPGGLSAISLEDFNGDGIVDVAAGTLASPDVSVFLGTGPGTFDPTAFTYTIGQTTRSLDLGDINGDGFTDLALVRSGQSTVFVRLGTGTGGSGEPVFSATETPFAVGTEPRSVKIVDIDGDGKQDLVVANSGSNNVSVLRGNGNGTFAAATNYAAGNGSRAVAVADLDVNGSMDILVGNEAADTFSVLWSPTSGSVGSDIIRGGDGNDTLDGGAGDAGNDTIYGGAGDDVIRGRNGNDRLFGDAGNDTLNGGLGADTITGGAGDDAYIIDELGETIVENIGEGNDRVRSSITYALSANLENLVLTGTANITGTSSALDGFILGNIGNNNLNGGAGKNTLIGLDGNDVIRGNGGDDTLIGGLGNDTLRGGTGNDIFQFNATGEGLDRILDFIVVEDTIEISAAGFGLSAGALAASAFVSGAGITTAGTAAHRFIYNTSNGALFFDADGNGAGASIQLATLSGTPAITNADIVII